jgi:nitroimidazol reductase NimA-like FMN-containing flavoprotein (pyridoxamine 5'-phosphate oxidase superfamily)
LPLAGNDSRRLKPRRDRPYMPGYGMMFQKDRGSLPWSWAVKRLSTAHNYWFATSRPDGKPHVMPVWGVWLDGMFFFSTGRRSSKSRNLTANPKCTVSPDGAGEAVILEGVAREVRETTRLRRFESAYKKKI